MVILRGIVDADIDDFCKFFYISSPFFLCFFFFSAGEGLHGKALPGAGEGLCNFAGRRPGCEGPRKTGLGPPHPRLAMVSPRAFVALLAEAKVALAYFG